jgi:Flp pilus assembly protein CpaB
MKLLNAFLLLLAAALLSLSFADLTANDVVEGSADMNLKEVPRRLMMVSVDRLSMGATRISANIPRDVPPWLLSRISNKSPFCLYRTGQGKGKRILR